MDGGRLDEGYYSSPSQEYSDSKVVKTSRGMLQMRPPQVYKEDENSSEKNKAKRGMDNVR